MAKLNGQYSITEQSDIVVRPLIEPEFWREVNLVTVRGRPQSARSCAKPCARNGLANRRPPCTSATRRRAPNARSVKLGGILEITSRIDLGLRSILRLHDPPPIFAADGTRIAQ
jgi:hypothetical protein